MQKYIKITSVFVECKLKLKNGTVRVFFIIEVTYLRDCLMGFSTVTSTLLTCGGSRVMILNLSFISLTYFQLIILLTVSNCAHSSASFSPSHSNEVQLFLQKSSKLLDTNVPYILSIERIQHHLKNKKFDYIAIHCDCLLLNSFEIMLIPHTFNFSTPAKNIVHDSRIPMRQSQTSATSMNWTQKIQPTSGTPAHLSTKQGVILC